MSTRTHTRPTVASTNARIDSMEVTLKAILSTLQTLALPGAPTAKSAPATGTAEAPLYVRKVWTCAACGRDDFGKSGKGAVTHAMNADNSARCERTSARDLGFGTPLEIAAILAA